MQITNWQKLWGISFVSLLTFLVGGYLVSPETVASHFTTSQPDAYMSRGTFLFFSVTIAAVVNGCYLPFGMRRFMRRVPESFWNLPDKQWWFRDEQNRELLYRRMVRAMAITGFGTNVVLAAVFMVVLGYNLGLLGIMWVNVVVIMTVTLSLLTIVPFFLAIQRPDRVA